MLFTNTSIFYFFKRLDNAVTLECSVVMMPLHNEHTTAYTFTVSLINGTETVTATEENVTKSRDKAEMLFNLICDGNIPPPKLAKLAAEVRANL